MQVKDMKSTLSNYCLEHNLSGSLNWDCYDATTEQIFLYVDSNDVWNSEHGKIQAAFQKINKRLLLCRLQKIKHATEDESCE